MTAACVARKMFHCAVAEPAAFMDLHKKHLIKMLDWRWTTEDKYGKGWMLLGLWCSAVLYSNKSSSDLLYAIEELLSAGPIFYTSSFSQEMKSDSKAGIWRGGAVLNQQLWGWFRVNERINSLLSLIHSFVCLVISKASRLLSSHIHHFYKLKL